jgi:O-antigen/teichoic acid export membrane protein
MRELNVLTRNISWNYLEAGVGLVVYFFLTPIVVDALGAVGFGMWVLLNAILFYLKFLDLGFYNALVKYVAECSERRDWPTVNGLIATTIAVLLIAGVVALFGSGLVAWLLVPNVFNVPAENVAELQLATLLIGIDLLIAFPASALNAVLEGRQRFDVLSGISIPLRIAGALATVLVLDAGYGVTALVGIAVAVTVADAVACWTLIGRLFPEIRLSVASIARAADTRHLMRTRSYSTWTSLNEILAEGGAELEKLLIPVLLSVSLLTPYTLIVTVCAAIFLAIEPITDTFFPLSSAYDAGSDKTRLRELLTRGTKLVVGISLPLAVAITFYGRDFILIWIGAGNVEVPELCRHCVHSHGHDDSPRRGSRPGSVLDGHRRARIGRAAGPLERAENGARGLGREPAGGQRAGYGRLDRSLSMPVARPEHRGLPRRKSAAPGARRRPDGARDRRARPRFTGRFAVAHRAQ